MTPAPTAGALTIQATPIGISISSPEWKSLRLRGLKPHLKVNDRESSPTALNAKQDNEALVVQATFASSRITMTQRFESFHKKWTRVTTALTNEGAKPVLLQNLRVFDSQGSASAKGFFGLPDRLRVYRQEKYEAAVYWARKKQAAADTSGEDQGGHKPTPYSELVWMAYDTQSQFALLTGFLSSERWRGEIHFEATEKDQERWWAGMDMGDLLLQPGQSLEVHPMVFMLSRDPWSLLEQYGDLTAADRTFPDVSPVTFCSWYPYRLSVSETAMLDTARVAQTRLKPLGLKTIQVDLGWERDHLSSQIEENSQFPHGLKWLAGKLNQLGFNLGAWWAPYAISEFDPLVKEHPEWLIHDEDGKLRSDSKWFWEPHGNIYILDLTHPGAQAWLKAGIDSLVRRGVRYLKADFIGMVHGAANRQRHDPAVVAGGGSEAGRIGAEILQDALFSADPPGMFLSCGGPDMPGRGGPSLIYTCWDTGNTGYTGFRFLRQVFMTVACHLFKHHRWGIIQPSTLCVGPPGPVTEARARATVAFLSGGEISISDDLTALPEDRWKILLATLPPTERSAKVVDLFDPIPNATLDYAASTAAGKNVYAAPDVQAAEPARVWHLPMKTEWDTWDVVGVLDYGPEVNKEISDVVIINIPFKKLGLKTQEDYWVHEFWSGQSLFLSRTNSARKIGYTHPGDNRIVVSRPELNLLSVRFFGPDAKLLVIRKARRHPWPVATTFHQSGGQELTDVAWNAGKRVLSGTLRRPEGESGSVFVACPNRSPKRVSVDGCEIPYRKGGGDTIVFDVICLTDQTDWRIAF